MLGIKQSGRALAVLLLCTHASSALAAGCRYQTLMPAFQQFLEQQQGQPIEAQGKAFAEEFAARFPDYYGAPTFGGPEKIATKAARYLDPGRQRTFPGFQPFSMERMLERGRTIDEAFASAQAGFLREFPDFRCDTFVAFGPSLFHFDGHVYDGADGQHRLLFGVDLISIIHTGASIPAFFHHELFHIYQSEVLGDAEPSENDAPVWWVLWKEGLATYVSHRMNPSLALQETLWFPADLAEKAEANRTELARRLLTDLDGAEDRYALYFQGGSGPDGLPARSGYYMGYLLAKEIGDGRLLGELARMNPTDVRRAAERFLRREAGGDTPDAQPSRTR